MRLRRDAGTGRRHGVPRLQGKPPARVAVSAGKKRQISREGPPESRLKAA